MSASALAFALSPGPASFSSPCSSLPSASPPPPPLALLPPLTAPPPSSQCVRAQVRSSAVLRRPLRVALASRAFQCQPPPLRGGARRALPGLMRAWCAAEAAPPTELSQPQWSAAALGAPGWAAEEGEACDWAERTTTEVPFRVCTFPRSKDTQVSAYIHKEGHWSGWKKGLVQEMLPVLDSADAWNAAGGRTLVLDVRCCI